jgi:hypothetical protein
VIKDNIVIIARQPVPRRPDNLGFNLCPARPSRTNVKKGIIRIQMV